MSWQQLAPRDAAHFLNAVAMKDEKTIFDPSLCEVHTLPLSFYDGYSLTRIVNKHMLPYLLLDYLSNGENHYYLNGAEAAFHNLNARHAISLDESNALDYLNLYISYVYERGNSFEFVQEPVDGFETKLLSHDKGIYQIAAPLHYQNNIVQSRVDVEQNGAIHVREPINVSFLVDLKPGDEIAYRHPFEEPIIQQCEELLGTTETGRKTLEMGKKAGAQIRIFASPNYHGFITNDRIIYIMMPAAEQSAKYLQAILLAGYLKNAAQMTEGYMYPPPGEDADLYLAVNHGKNLDMLAVMCKIVGELETQNMQEGIHALQQIGLESVYHGYKNNPDRQAMMDIYLKALEQQGLLED